MLRDLLESLVLASEKAANIARACRSEASLFELLVQEKTGADKNAKFVHDFKTLADVLIQAIINTVLRVLVVTLGRYKPVGFIIDINSSLLNLIFRKQSGMISASSFPL